MAPKHTNRLIKESSPYLLQHAHNPVDWYPWGAEALDRAKKEDKPILLSIGYSACHWCHVMEGECFENESIARLMNERFVCIKVDREERPDLDELYMNALQMLTGSGGWPMTLFLTPDLVPFHGGTYFPPDDRRGLPGFPKVLVTVSDYYRTHRSQVSAMTLQLREAFRQMMEIAPSKGELDPKVLPLAFETFERHYDPVAGGFGGAPKFPQAPTLSFLLRYWNRTGEKRALAMVDHTLRKMAEGGIYDHLGGGFHRYSVDTRWLVPHFEKMLYDNALLARMFLEAYQTSHEPGFRRIAEETLRYVERDMRDPGGGFYSAQDADSEGEEGKYYLWTSKEIEEILGKEKARLFCAYYGIKPPGNFESGRSILSVAQSRQQVSEMYDVSLHELEGLLEEGRNRLFAERQRRPQPHRDEKILTSWNGLTISSFAEAFKATGTKRYLLRAQEAASFIVHELKEGDRLLRVSKDGRSYTKGVAEDYAFLIQGLLDLYEASFAPYWIEEAESLQHEMIREFWDATRGGFFFGGEGEPLFARSKNPYDNAVPSPNSVGVFNLLRLGCLTDQETLKKKAEAILRLFLGLASHQPFGFPHLLSAFLFYLGQEEIAVMGPKEDERTKRFIQELHRSYLPNAVLSLSDPDEPQKIRSPFGQGQEASGRAPDAPKVLICRKSSCLPPLTDLEALRRVIQSTPEDPSKSR